MSRCPGARLIPLAVFLLSGFLLADDQAVWREYGLVHSNTAKQGNLTITTYQMNDLTGALAAWQWLRSAKARTCNLATFCASQGDKTVIFEDNYVLSLEGPVPGKADVEQVLGALPNKKGTALPPILSFVPQDGIVPNSSRYVLGQASLDAFAPELSATRPGFEQGVEGEIVEYKLESSPDPLHLALFYYPTPEMARRHVGAFKTVAGTHVKRSGLLVAVVYGSAVDQQSADTLLSRVEYNAKVTFNDVPPPSPIKPLYQLLLNILYVSLTLAALCLAAGLIYAGMRIYRRRFGTLEADEAMTTLHLTQD